MNIKKLKLARTIIYSIALAAVGFYIAIQGEKPWGIIFNNWSLILFAANITAFSLVIQANNFKFFLPSTLLHIKLLDLIKIWAVSGLASLIAPFIANLAIRITLLSAQGISLRESSLATLKQTIGNLEYSLLASALALFFTMEKPYLVEAIFLLTWFIWSVFIRLVRQKKITQLFGKWDISNIFAKPEAKFYSLLQSAQVLVMSFNIFLCYRALGADLSLSEAVLLASANIWSSLLIILPHGVGILDALWIFMAKKHGLDTAQSTAVALVLRLSFAVSAAALWAAITLINAKPSRSLP